MKKSRKVSGEEAIFGGLIFLQDEPKNFTVEERKLRRSTLCPRCVKKNVAEVTSFLKRSVDGVACFITRTLAKCRG